MQGIFSTVRWNSAKPEAAASISETAAAAAAAAAALLLSAVLTLSRFGSNERQLYKSTTSKVQLKSSESAINTEAIMYYLL